MDPQRSFQTKEYKTAIIKTIIELKKLAITEEEDKVLDAYMSNIEKELDEYKLFCAHQELREMIASNLGEDIDTSFRARMPNGEIKTFKDLKGFTECQTK